MKQKKWIFTGLATCIVVAALVFVLLVSKEKASCEAPTNAADSNHDAKPVIYLYPEETMDVCVSLSYGGTLTTTYPKYDETTGWRVTAMPDGTLINAADGKEYSYLFWEGTSNIDYDLTHGYVVKGADTAAFLQSTLSRMGLLPREYNEFIVYWLPYMEQNPFNLITFQTEAYTENAQLTIVPKPDSMLRVFMAFRALDAWMDVEAPILPQFERTGFTVVEWGGCEVR